MCEAPHWKSKNFVLMRLMHKSKHVRREEFLGATCRWPVGSQLVKKQCRESLKLSTFVQLQYHLFPINYKVTFCVLSISLLCSMISSFVFL